MTVIKSGLKRLAFAKLVGHGDVYRLRQFQL
jgi:hypothetical protein